MFQATDTAENSIHSTKRDAIRLLQQFRPGWSGYMSNVSAGSHPGKAEITMLLIINLDPTDMPCIYSTFTFVLDQAKHLEVATPCITLDQPLWQKSTEIINTLSLNIIVILGDYDEFCRQPL